MSERAHVRIQDNPGASRYEAVDEAGVVAGFAEYERRDRAVVLTHTVVDDAFEGHGVGSALARGALDDLRGSGTKVIVVCPFVRDWIDRHPDYQDLL